eukprot:326001_1
MGSCLAVVALCAGGFMGPEEGDFFPLNEWFHHFNVGLMEMMSDELGDCGDDTFGSSCGFPAPTFKDGALNVCCHNGICCYSYIESGNFENIFGYPLFIGCTNTSVNICEIETCLSEGDRCEDIEELICEDEYTNEFIDTLNPTELCNYRPTESPTAIPSTIPSRIPSRIPSHIPSHIPSNVPSNIPTTAPTLNPTLSPTHVPSNSPSFTPTNTPTIPPTLTPSVSPSNIPSHAPTELPTQSPSTAPSIQPTYAPTSATNAPSTEPTTCHEIPVKYDQLTTLNSMDGKTEEYPLNITQQIIDLKNATGKIPDFHTKGTSYRNENIFCSSIHTKPETCFIECDEDSGCDGATVSPYLPATKNLSIVCSKRDACSNMKIEMKEKYVVDFVIICSAQSSCESIHVDIASSRDMNIAVICGDKSSCNKAIIQLDTTRDDNNVNLDVICNVYKACDEMHINTNNKNNIILTMQMHDYSKDITIVQNDGHIDKHNINLVCTAPNGTHFIEYDIDDEKLSDTEILKRSRDAYGTDQLPCEGININCTRGDISRNCIIEYNLTLDVKNKLSRIRDDTLYENPNVNCYWLRVEDLYNISCAGTCNTTFNTVESKKRDSSEQNKLVVIFICVILSLLLIIAFILYRYLKTKIDRAKQAMKIKNPMVLVIGIQNYSIDLRQDDDFDIENEVNNLDIAESIKKLLSFYRNMNYVSVFAHPHNETNIETQTQNRWTRDELFNFLDKQATLLENNIQQIDNSKCCCCLSNHNSDIQYFDGLIVVISSRGAPDFVCTSDYKMVSRENIHRRFSAKNSSSRKIPRVFIFDSYDLSGEEHVLLERQDTTKGNKRHKKTNSGKTTPNTQTTGDLGKSKSGFNFKVTGTKATERKETERADYIQPEWKVSDNNPDNKLAWIYSANSDPKQSFISAYVEKLESKSDYFLGEIVEEIAEDEHPLTSVLNDKTFNVLLIKGTLHAGMNSGDKQKPQDNNVELTPMTKTTN